jgi:hypothetical protein
MFNRSCLNCGSRFTYAVPTRARIKKDANGKIEEDDKGNPIKVMCRRCRNCGEDYYEDGAVSRVLTETERKMLDAVNQYRESKNKKLQ